MKRFVNGINETERGKRTVANIDNKECGKEENGEITTVNKNKNNELSG